MRRLLSRRFLLPLLTAAAACPAPAAGARAADEAKPIKALLVLGGCCHDYAKQKDILSKGISARANVQWTIAYDPDKGTKHLNPVYENEEWAKGFDVVVHDECSADVKDPAVIERILKPHKDGLPGVVLHCGMHSFRGAGYPKASASFSDRFGGQPGKAVDGKVVFVPTPMNRWTSYGSPNATDWLEVDFGAEREVGRVELHVYDDRGGVQPPERYAVQAWRDGAWRDVEDQKATPEVPTGGTANTVTFKRATTSKIRVVFTNRGKARSGVTEVEAWRE